MKANSGEIWLPVTDQTADKLSSVTPVELHVEDAAKTVAAVEPAPQNSTSAPQTATTEKAPAADTSTAPETTANKAAAPAPATAAPAQTAVSEDFEKGKIAGLQEAILAIMEKNGPVTDQMRKDVTDNVYHDSLINWIKSFR